MKTISFFTICFGISFCIAQTNPDSDNITSDDYNNSENEYNPDSEIGTEPNSTEPNSEEYQEGSNYNPDDNITETNRTDSYESPKQQERVQYYSGSHRGTNIINPINNNFDAREGSGNNRGTDFPDVVRYYSGSHYGTNIINKGRVDKVKDAYMNNPVDDIQYNGQDNSGADEIPEDSIVPDEGTMQPNE